MQSDRRGLRVDAQVVRSWLDRLDRQARPPLAELRACPRFRYRQAGVTLELPREDGAGIAYAVACRNISRGGLGLLAGQFIYPQVPCLVNLVSPFGRTQLVSGRVARCRYLMGSGTLYDVGVALDRPVDVAVFAPHGKFIRLLLIADDLATAQLITNFLRGWHAELICAATESEALGAVRAGSLDLILIDLESSAFDAFGIVRQLRAEGYVGPVIGLAVQTGPELRARCGQAGCTGYVAKPITRDDLDDLLTALLDPPLVSSLAHDPAMAPLIDRFVDQLREKVTSISRAVQNDDLPSLQRLARGLQAEAGSYGFEIISKQAAYVQALIAAGQTPRRISRAARHLMHLCLKARPGTSPIEVAAGPPRLDGTAGAR